MKVVCTQNMIINDLDFKVKVIYEVISERRFIGDYGLQIYYEYSLSGVTAWLPEDFFALVGDNITFNTDDVLTAAYKYVGKATNSIQDFKKAYKEYLGIDITPENYRNDSKEEAEVGLPPGKAVGRVK